ncbi:predicted protein [Histoplasma capsulatum var. duboisii H88]|uniref:Predicted protein n=2 Tax=Ajellomyces capsulatus TaxID=5037 RepID=F0UA79_AJEC8|nr:predicted protein [Histoplasma capsulatum H143]EGC43641.1 predicted protein [Histoplasma capsulatum var. duboisii H88]
MFRRDLRESSLLLRTSRTDETPNLSDVFLFYSIRRRSLIEKSCHTKLLQSCSTPWALLAQEDKLRGSEFSVHGLQISDRRLHRYKLGHFGNEDPGPAALQHNSDILLDERGDSFGFHGFNRMSQVEERRFRHIQHRSIRDRSPYLRGYEKSKAIPGYKY